MNDHMDTAMENAVTHLAETLFQLHVQTMPTTQGIRQARREGVGTLYPGKLPHSLQQALLAPLDQQYTAAAA